MASKERRNNEGKPPTAILQAIQEMPWYQRFAVKLIGLTLMIVPPIVGFRLVPHFIHEDTGWVLALVLLGFLGIHMFIGLLITIPKAAVFAAGLLHFIPIPAKWKQSLTERPERRNNG